MISKAIENAQRKVEGHNFEIRKQLLKYDDVMNQQREVIYKQRREALTGKSLKPAIEDMIRGLSEKITDGFADQRVLPEEWDWRGLREAAYHQFGFRLNTDRDTMSGLTRDGLAESIFETAMKIYEEKETAFGTEQFRNLEQMIVLQVVDNLWKEHLLAMDHLKEGIGLRGYAQQDPLVVYKKEGFEMFMAMIQRVKEETVRFLFRVQIARPEEMAAKERYAQQTEAELENACNNQTRAEQIAYSATVLRENVRVHSSILNYLHLACPQGSPLIEAYRQKLDEAAMTTRDTVDDLIESIIVMPDKKLVINYNFPLIENIRSRQLTIAS